MYVSDVVVAETYHGLCHHHQVPTKDAIENHTEFQSSPMIIPGGHPRVFLTARALNTQQLIDNPADASFTSFYGDCTCGTVLHTGATFHAEVARAHKRFFILKSENSMGTNHRTHAATDTSVLITRKGNHIFQISKFSHFYILLVTSTGKLPTNRSR
jgi:hypothetical protein